MPPMALPFLMPRWYPGGQNRPLSVPKPPPRQTRPAPSCATSLRACWSNARVRITVTCISATAAAISALLCAMSRRISMCAVDASAIRRSLKKQAGALPNSQPPTPRTEPLSVMESTMRLVRTDSEILAGSHGSLFVSTDTGSRPPRHAFLTEHHFWQGPSATSGAGSGSSSGCGAGGMRWTFTFESAASATSSLMSPGNFFASSRRRSTDCSAFDFWRGSRGW